MGKTFAKLTYQQHDRETISFHSLYRKRDIENKH